MKNKYDIIIIGGGPGGVISAVTSRMYNPDKNILLIKDISQGVIPCGIPYMFTTLKSPEDNAMGNMPLDKNKIDLKIDKVVKINKKEKQIFTENNSCIKYDKLVLAIGSNPIIPRIKGIEKKGVYPIYKEMNYLKDFKNRVKKSKNIVIIGGGFIGVEFADELSNLKNANISLVELLPEILGNSFDKEFSEKVGKELLGKGVKIYNNLSVKEIRGNKKVESVLLSNGKSISADLIVLGIGSNSNVNLASESKLKIIKNSILVDKYLQTSDKNIFAIGDCATKKDFFSKNKINAMLASTATTEARIAGYNLFSKNLQENKGTLASYSTKIGKLVLGSTGVSEKTAEKRNMEVISGVAQTADKHPGKLPNTSLINIKLIFSKKDKILLGGQVMGGDSVGEMINIISAAIQKKFTIKELESLQIATHPKLTAAPTTYPIINAAQNALQKIK